MAAECRDGIIQQKCANSLENRDVQHRRKVRRAFRIQSPGNDPETRGNRDSVWGAGQFCQTGSTVIYTEYTVGESIVDYLYRFHEVFSLRFKHRWENVSSLGAQGFKDASSYFVCRITFTKLWWRSGLFKTLLLLFFPSETLLSVGLISRQVQFL